MTGRTNRLLVAGDWHGNATWGRNLIRQAADLRISTLLQLGDFGIWTRRETNRYLGWLEREATRCGVTVFPISGNHEDYDEVDAFEEHPDPDGFVSLRPHVRWIPRGHRWVWEGVRFGALGGAFSIDWRDRIPGRSWWPQREEVGDHDVTRLGEAPLDVLVTHEAPAGMEPPPRFIVPRSTDDRSRESRVRVLRAMRATHPRLVLHGHWHTRSSKVVEDHDGTVFRVEGLASDEEASGESWGVLDLPSLTFNDGVHVTGA